MRMLLLLFSCLCLTAQSSSSEFLLHIDGCGDLVQNGSGQNINIVASNPTLDTVEERSTVFVRFTNCTIPSGVNINIAIPPRSSVGGVTHIAIENTTMMHCGSLLIVPQDPAAHPVVENVRIIVNNAVLEGSGDVLVVKADGGVRNVGMELHSAVITSSGGDVASIVTGGSGVVSNVHLLVGGNTTMEAKHLVASVQASSVVDTTLSVDSSSRCTGPITLSAGGASVDGLVGVLSVVAVPTPKTFVCRVHNLKILVSSDPDESAASTGCKLSSSNDDRVKKNNNIVLASHVKGGSAGTASLVVQYIDHLEMHLSGSVTIDSKFVGLKKPLETGVGNNNEKHLIKAISSGPQSIAAVGSIAAAGTDGSQVSNVSLQLNNCRLSLESSIRNVMSGSVVLSASGIVSAPIFGVAMASHCWRYSSTNLLVTNGSSIRIMSLAMNTHALHVSSMSSSSFVTSAVFGISLYTYSHYDIPNAVIRVRDSNLVIGASVNNSGTVTMQCTSRAVAAIALFGVSVLAHSMENAAATSQTIGNSSCITIASSFSHSQQILLATTTGDHTSNALLGLATYASGVTTTHHQLDLNHSNVTIFSSTKRCSRFGISLHTSRQNCASSAMGIALAASNGAATMTLDVRSTLTLHSLLMDGAAISVSPSIVALLGVIVHGSAGGTIAVGMVNDQQLPTKIMDIWVGTSSHSRISAEKGQGSSAVVVGVGTSYITRLNANNTAFSFCSDGTVHPAAPQGVVLGTFPTIDGVIVSKTSWHPTDESTNLSSCSVKAQTTEDLIHTAVHGAATPAQSTPTRSPSPSLTQESSSQTLPLTATTSATTGASLSINLNATHTTSATDQLPPPPTPSRAPPSSPPRRVKVTTSILLPDNEQAATVVLSTAGASGAVGSTLGSGGAGVVVTAGSSVSMMDCGVSDGEDPKPASFQMPIQFAVGSGTMRYFAGASLAHTLLQCFLLGLPIAVRRWRKAMVAMKKKTHDDDAQGDDDDGHEAGPGKAVTYLAMLFCGAHPFFTPAILGACSTVLSNDDDRLGLAVAACSALVVVALHLVVVGAVHRAPLNGLVAKPLQQDHNHAVKLQFRVLRSKSGSSSSSGSTTTSSSSSSDSDDDQTTSSSTSTPTATSTSSSSSRLSRLTAASLLFSGEATRDILLTLFDGCRVFEQASHRHYASVETTLYSIIAVISGARPKENCSAAAFAIGALAATQLLYIVVIRPFRTRLDVLFSLLNAVLLVVLSVSVAVSVQKRSASDGQEAPEEWVLKTVEICLWLIGSLGYLQLVVQGYWAYHVQQRRQQLLKELANGECSESSDDGEQSKSSTSTASLDEPLLTVVEMKEQRGGGERRKLHNGPHDDGDTDNIDGMQNPLMLKAV